jgi:hypothetical protein
MSKPLEPGMNGELSQSAALSEGLLIKLDPASSALEAVAARTLGMRR